MPTSHGLLDVLFERRSVVRSNGDIDELLGLQLRNVSSNEYDFSRRGEWVTFRVTDSVSHCRSAYDPLDACKWEYGTQNGEFVLAAQPTIGIQPGHTRMFGAHLLRSKRVWASPDEIHFDDPVPLGGIDPLVVRQSSARAVVILPERCDGWTISTPDLDAIVTTRLAVFDFAYGGSGEWQSIRLRGRAPSNHLAVLGYDDVVAELNVLLGHDISGKPVDFSDVLQKIRRFRRTAVQTNGSSFRRGFRPDRPARIEQVREAIEDLLRARPAFFREATAAAKTFPLARGNSSSRLRRGGNFVVEDLPSARSLPPSPIEVFVSYSHRDDPIHEELKVHLAQLTRTRVIRTWHDREIGAGETWGDAIDAHLEAARIFVLLVSPDFLASDYCYDQEMKRALARHRAGRAVVIPVIVRDCLWTRTPLARLQVLPEDGTPIAHWPNRDEVWTNVSIAIEAAALHLAEAQQERT